jgi:hypothetical protein
LATLKIKKPPLNLKVHKLLDLRSQTTIKFLLVFSRKPAESPVFLSFTKELRLAGPLFDLVLFLKPKI